MFDFTDMQTIHLRQHEFEGHIVSFFKSRNSHDLEQTQTTMYDIIYSSLTKAGVKKLADTPSFQKRTAERIIGSFVMLGAMPQNPFQYTVDIADDEVRRFLNPYSSGQLT